MHGLVHYTIPRFKLKLLVFMITHQHAAKYIDPAESGAVLPIVHVNGFKISERTIYGCMDDKEMVCLFTGYGYQCRFVEDLGDIVFFHFHVLTLQELTCVGPRPCHKHAVGS